ncbi:MAG: hypothetical protein Nk1A_3930 [Endomicrobiia bacterium]|nr:MAG: hypothetical protein Nk1A_3930 [Endomicrobiia bacterium]
MRVVNKNKQSMGLSLDVEVSRLKEKEEDKNLRVGNYNLIDGNERLKERRT